MIEAAPNSADLQDFQFKIHSKLKIFDKIDDLHFNKASNLVVAASKYGLVLIGTPKSTIEVVLLRTIEENNIRSETNDFPRRTYTLPSAPCHLSLNCDHSLLAVVLTRDNCVCAIIYSVPSFFSRNVVIVKEIRLSATPNVEVLECNWNPAIPHIFTACKSDGSLGVYELKDGSVDINEIPTMANATCFCWSPKGKQIVVGSMNGTLTQYKPDLKAVKSIPTPSLEGAGSFKVVNVFWLSNYQFVAIYLDMADSDTKATILIVNAPKTGGTSFINFDDICYSYGKLRSAQYYIVHQSTWGVLLMASANSMEVGVLGIIQNGDPAVWQQWNQVDAARAELPLSVDHLETFPIGFTFDVGCTKEILWSENQSLPPMPMVHLLSHHGVLCSFNVINMLQGAAPLCFPPVTVSDQSGFDQFVIPKKNENVVPKPVSLVQQTPEIHSTPIVNPISAVQSVPIAHAASIVQSAPVAPTSQISAFQSPTQPIQFGQSTNLIQPSQSVMNVQTASNMPTLFKATQSSTAPVFASPSSTAFATSATKSPTVSFSVTSSPVPVVPPQFTQSSIGLFNPPSTTSITSTDKSNSLLDIKKISEKVDILKEQDEDKEEIDEEAVRELITEEMSNFQIELQEVLKNAKNIMLDVGTEEEKSKLVISTESLSDFYKELQEIMDSQIAEVHYLKQTLVQCYAWYVDAKSRYRRFVDPTISSLLQSQELDPVSDKQLTDIKHLMYYIEAQLKQVDGFLDNQWAEFQDSCRKQIKGKMHIPVLEPVYQSMVRQNAILQKQSYILKDIGSIIKSRNRKAAALPHVINLHSFNENETSLDEELHKLKLDHCDVSSLKYDKIAMTEKIFTDKKEQKLCTFFSNCSITRVSPRKPKFLDISLTPAKLSMCRSLAIKAKELEAETNISSSNLFTFPLTISRKEDNIKISSSVKSEVKVIPIVTTISAIVSEKPRTNFTFSSISTTSSTFTFSAPVPKPTEIRAPKTVTTSQNEIKLGQALFKVPEAPKDALDMTSSAFSFGSGLSLGQQSTPKPKAAVSLNFGQGSATFTTQPVKPKPTTTLATSTASAITTPLSEPNAPTFGLSKPLFGSASTVFTSTTVSTASNIFDTKSTIATTNVTSSGVVFAPKPTIMNAPTSTSSLFVSKSVVSVPVSSVISKSPITTTITTVPSTNTIFVGKQVTSTTSNFSAVCSTNTVVSPKISIQLGSIFTSTSSATSGISTGSLFAPKDTTSGFTFTLPTTSCTESESKPQTVFGNFSFNNSSSNIFGGTPISTPSSATNSVTVVKPSPQPTTVSVVPVSAISTSAPASAEITNVLAQVTPTTAVTVISNQSSGVVEISTSSIQEPLKTPTFSSPTTLSAPVFGASALTMTPVFGSSASVSTASPLDFASLSKSLPVFGGSPAITTPAFDSLTTTSIKTTPVTTTLPFSSVTTCTTSLPTFESAIPTITSTSSAPSSTAISTTSIFGSASKPTTAPAFGGAPVFGSPAPTAATTTTTSGFGFNSSGNDANKFSFGNLSISALSPNTTAPTTSTDTFSFTLPTSTAAATTQSGFGAFASNPFGKTSTSTFMGQNICSPQNTSMFGQNTGNIFAQKSTTPVTGSIFGGSSERSLFGSPTPTTSTTSPFGQTASSPFGAAPSTSSSSVFGSGFGTATTSSGSMFGQSTFGNPTTTSSFSFSQGASAFGTNTGNIFGAKPAFGAPPAFGQPAAFGGPPAFGSTAQSGSNIFGSPQQQQQSGSSFGSTSPTFGQKPAFGSPSAFGQSPAFGQTAAFGSPPAFGSQRTFGSGSSPTSTFGSTAQQNSTFANLANQSTVGFGSLAQNQGSPPQPQSPQFSGGTQFSSWR